MRFFLGVYVVAFCSLFSSGVWDVGSNIEYAVPMAPSASVTSFVTEFPLLSFCIILVG